MTDAMLKGKQTMRALALQFKSDYPEYKVVLSGDEEAVNVEEPKKSPGRPKKQEQPETANT